MYARRITAKLAPSAIAVTIAGPLPRKRSAAISVHSTALTSGNRRARPTHDIDSDTVAVGMDCASIIRQALPMPQH